MGRPIYIFTPFSRSYIRQQLDYGKFPWNLIGGKMSMKTSLEGQIRQGDRSRNVIPAESLGHHGAIPRPVVTYADVARSLKSTGYRAVGQALHRNPNRPGVPCHRVVGSDGKLTGFAHGLPKKRKMLEEEGVSFSGSRVDLAQCREKSAR